MLFKDTEDGCQSSNALTIDCMCIGQAKPLAKAVGDLVTKLRLSQIRRDIDAKTIVIG